jgi:hypothetical protein
VPAAQYVLAQNLGQNPSLCHSEWTWAWRPPIEMKVNPSPPRKRGSTGRRGGSRTAPTDFRRSAAERSEESRSGLFRRQTAGRDASCAAADSACQRAGPLGSVGA